MLCTKDMHLIMMAMVLAILVASFVDGLSSTQMYYRRNEFHEERYLKSSKSTIGKSSKKSLKEWFPKSSKSRKSVKSCKSFKSSKSSKSSKSLKSYVYCSDPPSSEPKVHTSISNEPSILTSSSSSPSLSRTPSTNPSISPTQECSSARAREEAILSNARKYSDDLTSNVAVKKALDFLRNDGFIKDGCDERAIRERYALAVFYYSTDGENWSNNSDWLTNEDHCNWYQLQCSDDKLSEIELEANKLHGTLPKELIALDSLAVLNVYQNTLSGTIPFEIYMLPLTELDFESNNLSGQPLPSDPNAFEAKTTLKNLKLSQNNFDEYELPNFLNEFPLLERLWVADSNVIGTIPRTINSLSNLRSFIASENSLSGTIPEMTASLQSLRNLQLDVNHLNSTIPASFGSATNLRVLELFNNSLTGTVPSSLSNLGQLEDFFLSNNDLEGIIPPEFSNLKKLVNITLERNNFFGPIPNFGSCEYLEFMSLSYNSFNGTIPSDLFDIPNLQNLYLNDNELTGSIPGNYGNPENLTDLYLNNNQLTGTIPDIAKDDWPKITEVLLSGNDLSDPVPDSICALNWKNKTLFADCEKNNCTCCTTCVPSPSAPPSTIESLSYSVIARTSSSTNTVFLSTLCITFVVSVTVSLVF